MSSGSRGPITPSRIKYEDDYALVELRRSGKKRPKWAKIDLEDVPLVEDLSWFPAKTAKKTYAARRHYLGNGKFTTLYLHRVIAGSIGSIKNLNIDFDNDDALDCRKVNLTIMSVPSHRAISHKTNKHGYRGVFKEHRSKNYVCRFMHNKKYMSSTHNTPEAAARAYDRLVKKYRKDHIEQQLNFPKGQTL